LNLASNKVILLHQLATSAFSSNSPARVLILKGFPPKIFGKLFHQLDKKQKIKIIIFLILRFPKATSTGVG